MAGFFGFFDYSKPGKGVYKNEPKKSHFVQFWVLVQRKFWKLIQLNLLYILFCIPIVTFGPATAAMTYVLRQYANEQPVFLFSDFWDTFRQNFKQSFIFGILQILFVIIMTISINFYYTNSTDHKWMLATFGLCFFVSVLALFSSFYIYPMIVTLDLKLKAIIKNGFIFSILGLKRNFFTLFALLLVALLIYLFSPITIFLVLFIALSFCGFIIVYNVYPTIKKYAIDPYLDSLREEKAVNDGAEAALEAQVYDGDDDDNEDETIFSDESIFPENTPYKNKDR